MPNNNSTIEMKDFSAGYHPGDDFINGAPNALIRMDNLWLDETGAVTITRAPSKVNNFSFNQPIYSLYSSILNGVRTRFAALADGSSQMDVGTGNFPIPFLHVPASPPSIPPAFGQGFGRVFSAGFSTQEKETDGVTVWNWGLNVNNATVTITQMVQAVCAPWYGTSGSNFTAFTASVGTIIGTSDGQVLARTNLAGNLTINYTPGGPLNLNVFTVSGDAGAATDVFYLCVFVGKSNTVANPTSITVTAQTSVGNTFSFVFTSFPHAITLIDGWVLLSCARSAFTTTGAPNWASIATVSISVVGPPTTTYTFTQPFEFYNSNNTNANLISSVGTLLGGTPYLYVLQFQWTNSQYTGLGQTGPVSRPIFGKWNSLTLTPFTLGIDTRINQYNVFKIGGTIGGTYFLVGSSTNIAGPGTLQDDNLDTFYLSQVGPNTQANIFLQDISAANTSTNQIIAIEGPINGRMCFATGSNIYLCDFLNPESYDTRLVLTLSGQKNELILFLTKTQQNVLLVGTTLDIYQITGTWQLQADGTFDIFIQSQGVKQPPISPAVGFLDNLIFWTAKDGLRQTFVGLISHLSGELNLLWRGQPCFSVPGFKIAPFSQALNPTQLFQMIVVKQKLYLKAIHTDNSQSMFVLDLQHRNWYRRVDPVSPICIFAEQDDTMLAGYNDGFVRIYDSSTQFDGTQPQFIFLQTGCKDGGEPNTRKDLFTLKLIAATGGSNLTINLLNDQQQSAFAGTLNVTGQNPILSIFPVQSLGIDKNRKYSLQVSGGAVYFKLDSWSLDVFNHPEPTAFYREQPNNFGYNGRKRIRTLPIILDPLGNSVTFQPIVDGLNVDIPAVFTGSGKKTYYYTFTTDVSGVDYSYTLYANGLSFEPYGVMGPVDVEKFPPPKLEDQLGPIVLDKRGKLYGFRVRLIATSTSINYNIIMDDVIVYSSSFVTQLNVDTTYEVLRLPQSLIGNVVRIVLTAPSIFYRYNGMIRATTSGMMSKQKWLPTEGEDKPSWT